MSRYTGPSWKQSRRLGFSLTGTGKELARRNYVPGQHGPNNRSKLSEYGLQLAEKQKLRFTYGVGEKQFRNLFLQATKIKGGILGFNFMLLLERPAFVSFNDKKLEGSLIRLPERDEINEALVVEFYNKIL